MVPQDSQGVEPTGQANPWNRARRGEGEAVAARGGQEGRQGRLSGAGQRGDAGAQGHPQDPHVQGAPQLGANADEKPAGHGARVRRAQEEHRGDGLDAVAD